MEHYKITAPCELLGLPAAGKSYILNKASCSFIMMDLRPKINKLASLLYVTVRCPRMMVFISKSFIFIDLRNFFKHLVGIVRFVIRYYDIKYSVPENAILEEGLVQSYWGVVCLFKINGSSKRYAELFFKKYVKSTMNPIVYVKSDKQANVGRNLKREKNRLKNFLIDANKSRRLRCWMAFTIKQVQLYSSIRTINNLKQG